MKITKKVLMNEKIKQYNESNTEQLKTEKLVSDITVFIKEKNLGGYLSIYYNNKGINIDESGNIEKIKENVKGSDFIGKYADGYIVTMMYEGNFYEIMNDNSYQNTYSAFYNLLDGLGYEFELINQTSLGISEK